MTINCVIVTYNRLPLLKECIAAVQNQTSHINKIFIIDNHSTDGTNDYLQKLKDDSRFSIVSLPLNTGGAGGFYEGIKRAASADCDWIWVMDDDTIPTNKALEELIKGTTVAANVGYVCSRVIWTDGKLHKMNIPAFLLENKQHLPINYFSYCADVMLIKNASFVSLLISAAAIYEAGLPIKEFFIWADDFEYTDRIYQKGYIGLYAGRSVALHKTAENYVSDPVTAPLDSLWKFEYGYRNKVFMRRQKKKSIFSFFSILNSYRRTVRRLKKRPVNERKQFIRVITRGFWKGLFFNPQIEYITDKKE